MTEQETTGFAALGIAQPIVRALDEMGFEEPSPIQAAAIPLLLEGRDVIGQAQTGTGKTAAFGIPLLQRLRPDVQRPQALVLAPTRELALQVAEEIGKIGKYLNVRELAIYGGSPIERQIKALRFGVSVVIGTPGRVMDLINRGTLKLDQVNTFVLDEADEMLDMGFVEDIETIMSHLPTERQMVCFSATMPAPIARLTKRYMNDPQTVAVARTELTAPSIEQAYFEIRERSRVDALARIIDHEAISRGIIFCRTKRNCDELASALQARGYLAEAIHGDLNQTQRNRVLSRFKEGQIELLIATDVAARGLDVENVTHVINYDIAQSPESHVHRIGRTGRAGREGVAFTLIHPREFRHLKLIEKVTRTPIPRRNVPTPSDVAERALDLLAQRVSGMVEEGGGPLTTYADLAGKLLEEHEPRHLVAALLASVAEPRSGAATSAAPSLPEVGRRSDRYERSDRFDRGPRLQTPGRALRPTARLGRPVRAGGADLGEKGVEPGYVRLFMNVGHRDQVTPADFVRTIAREAAIPGGMIGAIDIHENFTFVEVPRDVSTAVMEAMKNTSIQGRGLNVDLARPSN